MSNLYLVDLVMSNLYLVDLVIDMDVDGPDFIKSVEAEGIKVRLLTDFVAVVEGPAEKVVEFFYQGDEDSLWVVKGDSVFDAMDQYRRK